MALPPKIIGDLGEGVTPRPTGGATAYGFGLHSTRIPYTEYPLMFHGHNERVDTESLKLSALMWEALCHDFLG